MNSIPLFDNPGTSRTKSKSTVAPLAERMRPANLAEFIGQHHLVGPQKVLQRQIESGRVGSIILWGPPGTGKTTLARIIASEIKMPFVQLSAIDSGVADVRKVIADARKLANHSGQYILLFIDEIHRFNKAQQDALLHAIEEGVITLIGATTENPSFEVIRALLSRCSVNKLLPLADDELGKLLDRALIQDVDLKGRSIEISDRSYLVAAAGGDARKLYNILETAVAISKPGADGTIKISETQINDALQSKVLVYDKAGDQHYDVISAFIKSVRGSDPDAALYWMARMLEGGEDPKFIARRMIILASEDIGNADPYALTLAVSTFTAIDYIGMPEGQLVLSQCATYLAGCPKSNASYLAIKDAVHEVRQKPAVPGSTLFEQCLRRDYQVQVCT